MGGVATCYDALDGHIYWKERLPGKYSASPIAANGLVYFVNEEGITRVIQPGPTLKIVAENSLTVDSQEVFRASMAAAEGQLFLRSTSVLYCIGDKR
jgi:outer membrane protein assembly factor BamB